MEKSNQERLDIIVAEKTGFPRQYCKEIIESGFVAVNNKTATKAGEKFASDCQLTVNAEQLKYVSRGGYKLESALKEFNINLKGKICLDIGSSTGGFTDCMLQNEAQTIIAVDCGTGQMDERLKNNPNIILMENTNIRNVSTPEFLKRSGFEKFDFIAIDVSFISLTLVIPKAAELLEENGEMVCLIKPQFEAGKNALTKKGVVKSEKDRLKTVDKIYGSAYENGLKPLRHIQSPIIGRSGNIEYLLFLHNNK